MILYYHGSITPERLPESVIDAVARFNGRIRLGVAGYEAPGAIGYVGRLQARAGDADGAPIVRYAGRIPAHEMLLRHASESHVGLSLMPLDSSDVNMRHMTGASNKAFDYLSVGLPLLVSDLPDWRRFYVTPGFGLACDPGDPASIERALAWFVEHPEERRDMGAAGRRKVVESWNYEAQFQPVFRALEAFA
jgi:glycosyltransferase involved in cell wall biosynthesis